MTGLGAATGFPGLPLPVGAGNGADAGLATLDRPAFAEAVAAAASVETADLRADFVDGMLILRMM